MANRCDHPDCFTCPHSDCICDQMTVKEYVDANQRDMEYAEPSALHEYKQKSFDCSGRKEYFREWYRENRERHIRTGKEYRKRTHYKSKHDRSEYYREYYKNHRKEKIKQATERNKRIREALNATG